MQRNKRNDLGVQPGQAPAKPAITQTRQHFTRIDQVNRLVGASEADPEMGLYGADVGAVQPAQVKPRQPARVRPQNRAVHAGYVRRSESEVALREPAAPDPRLGLYRFWCRQDCRSDKIRSAPR